MRKRFRREVGMDQRSVVGGDQVGAALGKWGGTRGGAEARRGRGGVAGVGGAAGGAAAAVSLAAAVACADATTDAAGAVLARGSLDVASARAGCAASSGADVHVTRRSANQPPPTDAAMPNATTI